MARTSQIVTAPRKDGEGQHSEHEGSQHVGDHDLPASLHAIGDSAGHDAEEQPGQVVEEQRQGNEERIASQRRDHQRAGRDHDAVAEVVDDGG